MNLYRPNQSAGTMQIQMNIDSLVTTTPIAMAIMFRHRGATSLRSILFACQYFNQPPQKNHMHIYITFACVCGWLLTEISNHHFNYWTDLIKYRNEVFFFLLMFRSSIGHQKPILYSTNVLSFAINFFFSCLFNKYDDGNKKLHDNEIISFLMDFHFIFDYFLLFSFFFL